MDRSRLTTVDDYIIMTKYYLKFYYSHEESMYTASWGQFDDQDAARNGEANCSPVTYCDDPDKTRTWPDQDESEPTIIRNESDVLSDDELKVLANGGSEELRYITQQQYDELESIEDAGKVWSICCSLSINRKK